MDAPTLLFERSGVLAIAKPAGLATQAPPGVDSVESWLRRSLYGAAGRGYVGVPHRLDRAVSGVLLMTATPRAARKLSRQFEHRQVVKEYLAIVESLAADWTAPRTVEWRDFVAKVPDQARASVVTADAPAAREAVTRVRLLARLSAGPRGPRLLLALEPLTGRMHQLRLQAAARGLPIVGDLLYDPAADAGWCGDQPQGGREPPIALHAARIRYADPDTGAETVAAASLPAGWPPSSGGGWPIEGHEPPGATTRG
jgi:23S rRNA pseudouridine1911/1915/1917 synthase